MKKLCVLVAVLMALALPAMAVTPATPIYECGAYTYILREDGSAKIVLWDGADDALVVPEAMDGHVVTAIGEWAFEGCVDIVSIELPGTVEAIGDGAFAGCECLTRVSLPDSVAELGLSPFQGCDNLAFIDVSPEHPYLETIDGVLFTRPDKRLVCYPMGITATRYAVPEGTQVIGRTAFERNLYLEDIALPESVTGIGEAAFSGCGALERLNLPAAVSSIGDGALNGCDRLTLNVAPDSDGAAYALVNGIRDVVVSD